MAVRLLPKKLRRLRLDAERGRYRLGRVVEGSRIELDAEDVADGPKWQHVATTGAFKGYAGGELPFAFTLETFNQIVSNFRSHPSFEAGPDGFGKNGIVQWDFHHASEAPPDAVAQAGAPAQGWVLDLQVKPGPEGAYELWALTEWLPLAKGYIQSKQYKWASVAVSLDTIDPVSGQKIGAMLTSVAITNQPFIEGMNELVADRSGGTETLSPERDRARRIAADYYYQASSIEDARDCIRRKLGLPITATPADVAQGLMALIAIVQGGDDAEAMGVDADEMLRGFGTTLGLPLLTPLADVAQQALSLFDTETIEHAGEIETANGDGESIPGATTTSRKNAANAATENQHMSDQLLLALARKLGVQPSPEAVDAAVTGLISIKANLVDGLKLDRHAATEVVADATKDAVRKVALFGNRSKYAIAALALLCAGPASIVLGKKGKKVTLESEPDGEEHDGEPSDGMGKGDKLVQRLAALFKGAGIEDPERAVGQIVKTLTDAATLEETMPELEELRRYTKKAAEETKDDAVAATVRNYYEGDEDHVVVLSAFYDKVGKAKFLERFPAITDDAEGLEVPVAVTQQGQTVEVEEPAPSELDQRVAAMQRGRRGAPAARPAATSTVRATHRSMPEGVVNVDNYPGPNVTARAIAATKATIPGSDKWDWETLCEHSFKALKEGRYVSLSAGR